MISLKDQNHDFNLKIRTSQIRGYGNAIAPAVAAEFIRAYLET